MEEESNPSMEPEQTNESEEATSASNGVSEAVENTSEGSEVSDLEAKLKAAEDKYVYLYADFENYKKRMFKEKADIVKYGWEPVAMELLSVLDNLSRALEHANKENCGKRGR